MKLLFIPFSIVGGLIAGFIGKRVFEGAWGVIDDRKPPEPDQRDASLGKVVVAAALEGAVFKGTRALVDRGSRQAFASVTGSWPGHKAEEQ